MFDTKGLSYADGTPLADPRSPTACLCINVQVQNHKLRLGLLKGSLASGTEQSGFACLDTHLDLIHVISAWHGVRLKSIWSHRLPQVIAITSPFLSASVGCDELFEQI